MRILEGLWRIVRVLPDLVAYLATGLRWVERKKGAFTLEGLGYLHHPPGIAAYVHRHCSDVFLQGLASCGEVPFPPHVKVSPAELIGRFPDITKCDNCRIEFQPSDEGYMGYWVVSQRTFRQWDEIRGYHNNRGIAFSERGAFAEAIAEFDEALRFDFTFAAAYSNRGSARGRQGDLDRAIADCTRAIELDPDLAMAYTHRGCALFGKGTFDAAIADHTEAIRLDPDLALAYYNRGNAHGCKREYPQAIQDLTEFLRLSPRDAAALRIRAKLCRAVCREAEAAADERKADGLA